jgi:hypothetical protein
MSAEAKDTFTPNASQGDFWKGYMADGWFYKALAFFPITGFLGLDKLVLRSPSTAIFKFLINVFFWGAWYVYDIIQLLMDDTFVGKYGFSNPFGVSGHGYRLLSGISESKIDEFGEPSEYNGGITSNLLYLFYVGMTVFIGFSGLPMMLAGDFNGGLIKLFSNFLLLPFVFYLVNQILDFFNSGSVQKDGISHPWPMYPMLTIFEKHPASYLVSAAKAKKELEAHQTKYEPLIKAGKLPLIPELFMSLFGKLYEAANNIPVVAAFNTVSSAKGAALATSDMAQSAAKVGQKLATAMEQRISKDPNAVIDKLLGPGDGAAETFTVDNPMLKQAQKGGGLDFIPEGLDTIMLIGMGVLIVGGFAAAALRKFSVPRRQEDNEYPRKAYERDDTPPQPGGV